MYALTVNIVARSEPPGQALPRGRPSRPCFLQANSRRSLRSGGSYLRTSSGRQVSVAREVVAELIAGRCSVWLALRSSGVPALEEVQSVETAAARPGAEPGCGVPLAG